MGSETWGTEAPYYLSAFSLHLVMIFDLGDRRKRYLDDLTTRTFHLDTRSGQSLCGFHALNDAANAPTIQGHDLNVVFPIKRLECRKCFSDFHGYSCPFGAHGIEAHELIKPCDRFCTQAGRIVHPGSRIPKLSFLKPRLIYVSRAFQRGSK